MRGASPLTDVSISPSFSLLGADLAADQMAEYPSLHFCGIPRVKGNLDLRWSEWFDGFAITPVADGETLLVGSVVDQAALYGVLHKIRDLGLPLLSVRRLEGDE